MTGFKSAWWIVIIAIIAFIVLKAIIGKIFFELRWRKKHKNDQRMEEKAKEGDLNAQVHTSRRYWDLWCNTTVEYALRDSSYWLWVAIYNGARIDTMTQEVEKRLAIISRKTAGDGKANIRAIDTMMQQEGSAYLDREYEKQLFPNDIGDNLAEPFHQKMRAVHDDAKRSR